MKIGIDLLPLQADPKRRGISNFVYNTIKNLLLLEQNNQYYFFNSLEVNTDFITEISSNAQFIKEEISPDNSLNLDLFIYTSFFDFEKKYSDPANLKCKVAIIVYDIIPVILWEYYMNFFPEKTKIEYFRRIVRIRECDKILTISQSVKNDLVEILEMPPSTIDVIYAGIDLENKNYSSNYFSFNFLQKKFNIFNKYIFSVPSMDVRKNIFGLIEAYGLIDTSIKNEYQLVISNELNEEYETKLREHARKCGIPDNNLVFTNYVSEEELNILYQNSSIFVFPTFNEGFGLPVLEAMHHGIPVITSNVSSLPEVVGDAGILIDPHNIKEIANEIMNLLKNSQKMYELSIKGKNQSKKFSWTRTAKLLLDSCQNYCNSKSVLRLGIISSWNVKCGLATYTKYLTEKLNNCKILFFTYQSDEIVGYDGLNVKRCWDLPLNNYKLLYEEIIKAKIDIVHIQFNFGLMSLSKILELSQNLQKNGVKIIITFHSTQNVKIGNELIILEKYSHQLKGIDQIIVHTQSDKNRLENININSNVRIIPHGIKISSDFHSIIEKNKNLKSSFPVIATFGFCLPHKGILESIQAISILKNDYPKIHFLIISSIYPVEASELYYNKCNQEIEKLGLKTNVSFISDFLSEEYIFDHLIQSDLIVMPYIQTQESASGALRLTFAAKKPIIVTDIPIFDEYFNEVYKISHSDPKEISDGIKYLLNNINLQNNMINAVIEKMNQENWDSVAKIHEEVYYNLLYSNN